MGPLQGEWVCFKDSKNVLHEILDWRAREGQTKKTCCLKIFSFLDKNHLEWVWVVIRVVSKPGFLWNQINHGRHKIFQLFRSKALQKVKKIKNSCRFRVSNLPSKFLKKSLSKMTVFISKMKWHFRIFFF